MNTLNLDDLTYDILSFTIRLEHSRHSTCGTMRMKMYDEISEHGGYDKYIGYIIEDQYCKRDNTYHYKRILNHVIGTLKSIIVEIGDNKELAKKNLNNEKVYIRHHCQKMLGMDLTEYKNVSVF